MLSISFLDDSIHVSAVHFHLAGGIKHRYQHYANKGCYNSNNCHTPKGGGYGANGLIGVGGYGGGMIIEKTNGGDGYRGGGGGGGYHPIGRGGKGGDGYLCFMFVKYDFNA